jgi:O-antigen/teichoic acid export membrane protein
MQASRFTANLSKALVTNVYFRVLAFIIVPFVARSFSVQEFGVLNLAQMVLGYIVAFFDSGVRKAGVLYLSGKELEANIPVISGIFTIRIFLLAGAFVFMCLFGLITFRDSFNTLIIAIFALSLFPQILDISWVYDARQDFKVALLYRSVERTVMFLLTLSGVLLLNLYVVSFSNIAASLIAGLWLWIFYKKFPLRMVFSGNQKGMLKDGIIMGLSSISFSLSISVDQLMVNYMLNLEQFGFYAGATKIISVLTSFALVYSYVLFPTFSGYYNKGQFDLIRRTIRIHTVVSGTVISCLTFVFCVFARPVVLLTLSEKYYSIIPMYKVFLANLILVFFNILYSDLLNIFAKKKARLNIILFSIVLNIALSVFLIPALGILGAAIGAVISQAVILAASYPILAKAIKLNTWWIILLFIAVNFAIVAMSYGMGNL